MGEANQKMNTHCKFDEMVSVSKLKPHPKNRNKHPEEQIERLSKILKYQGLQLRQEPEGEVLDLRELVQKFEKEVLYLREWVQTLENRIHECNKRNALCIQERLKFGQDLETQIIKYNERENQTNNMLLEKNKQFMLLLKAQADNNKLSYEIQCLKENKHL